MNLEDRIFTRARLGRYWTIDRAKACSRFFTPVPYRFNAAREKEFMSRYLHDYSDHLLGLLKAHADSEDGMEATASQQPITEGGNHEVT